MPWICSNNPDHKFQKPTKDYFCTKCKNKDGLLMSDAVHMSENDSGKREVGLCVMIMDISTSMGKRAFGENSQSRLKYISQAASKGIFDLENMVKNEDIFICIFLFADEVEQLLFMSVKKITTKFDQEEFEEFLYQNMKRKRRFVSLTDINNALQVSFSLVDSFLTNKIEVIGDYKIMHHRILTHNAKSISVPNVRVLLYTDGEQNIRDKSNQKIINPFSEKNPDILMGIYFGQETERGCGQLKNVVSKCPDHNFPQFFLFDNPKEKDILRGIFRMASGASGFCIKCLS